MMKTTALVIMLATSAPIKQFVNKLGGCEGTQFGCCKDTNIPCSSSECMNCFIIPIGTTKTEIIGGCIGTKFGCCKDNVTQCVNMHCDNCNIQMIGGCIGTKFGCCKDNITQCVNTHCENC